MRPATPIGYARSLPRLLVLLLGLGGARRVGAEPPTAESRQPRPSVVVASVLDEGEDVRAQVQDQLLEDIAGRDISILGDEPLTIAITEAPDDAAAVRVAFHHRAQEIFSWTCVCGGAELQEQLPGATAEALRRIRAKATRSSAGESVAPLGVVAPEPVDERGLDRALAMHVTGIGMVGLGVGALAAGSSVAITRAVLGADAPAWSIACAVSGGALAAVGLPLLIVGHRRVFARSRVSLRIAPVGPGLALRGRF